MFLGCCQVAVYQYAGEKAGVLLSRSYSYTAFWQHSKLQSSPSSEGKGVRLVFHGGSDTVFLYGDSYPNSECQPLMEKLIL